MPPKAASSPLFHMRALVRSGETTRHTATTLIQHLRGFRHAEEAQRAIPMPFAPRMKFAPGEEPGTPRYDTLRSLVDGIDAELVTDGLQARIGTDSSRPPDPPSLRDAVSAAFDVHTGSNL